MEINKKYEIIFVAFCLLIFSFFIFDHIGKPAFWLDEAAPANVISGNFASLFSKAVADSHPLFYVFLLKLWSVFFGASESASRTFSAIFALLLLPTIYLFCRKWFDKKTATVALALTASNYFLVWFASQNRPYTLVTFLGLLSFYFFFEILKNPKKISVAFYILITVCGLYTHPWFYFIFGSQILSVLFWQRTKLKIFFYQAIIFSLALPNTIIFLYQRNLGVNSWISPPNLNDILSSLEFFASRCLNAYIIVSILALIFMFLKKEDKNVFKSFEFKSIFLYFFAPLLSAFFVSQYAPMYVAGRYEVIILPAFLILVSVLWSKIDSSVLIFVFLILFGMTGNAVIVDRDSVSSQKSSDKTVVSAVLSVAKDGDLIITTDLSFSTVYYYVERMKGTKNISVVSFPKEIENHPGWKNMKVMSAKKDLYQVEAENLAEGIKTDDKVGEVWVMYNSDNKIDSILINELEREIGAPKILIPQSPRQSSWFDSVYLFQKSPDGDHQGI